MSCVEEGRWGRHQASRRAANLAPSRLRGAKLATVHDRLGFSARRDAHQGEVWQQVAAYSVDHGVQSDTDSLEDVHLARAGDVRHLTEGTAALDGQRGIIAAAPGRILGVDLFDKPGTLARYWSALAGAYALDALTLDTAAPIATPLMEEAAAFLRAVLDAEGPRVPGVATGDEIHIRSNGIVGHALVWGDVIVHFSALPEPELVDAE